MSSYIGVSSKARKVAKAYIGVGNVARKISKMYIGDANGKARLFYVFDSLDPHILMAVDSSGNIRYSSDNGATWSTGSAADRRLLGYSAATKRWYGHAGSSSFSTIYYATTPNGIWTSSGISGNSFTIVSDKYVLVGTLSTNDVTVYNLDTGTSFSATTPFKVGGNRIATDGQGNFHTWNTTGYSDASFKVDVFDFTISSNAITVTAQYSYNRLYNRGNLSESMAFWNGQNFVDIALTDSSSVCVGAGGGDYTIVYSGTRLHHVIMTSTYFIAFGSSNTLLYAYGNIETPTGAWTYNSSGAMPSALANASVGMIYDGKYFYAFDLYNSGYVYRTNDLTQAWTQITNFNLKALSNQYVTFAISSSYPFISNTWRKY